MSGWVLLGLPGYAYLAGIEAGWIALGLCVGVSLNWLLMAKRLRVFSFHLEDVVTLPCYLHRRFQCPSPWLKLLSSVFILLFFLFYVSSGLIGAGKLFVAVFDFDYDFSVLLGAGIIIFYTFFGGGGGFLDGCFSGATDDAGSATGPNDRVDSFGWLHSICR